MKIRSKLLLAVLLEIALTIVIVILWAYQGAQDELEQLARDLLRAQTDFAYALCDRYNQRYGRPTEELKEQLSAVRIAVDGYLVALDNSDTPDKGRLIVHPTNAGDNLNNPRFPHIQRIINRIDQAGKPDRYSAYDEYHQETGARGRQGERKIAYYMYYKPWDWILLASAYERDLFQSAEVVRHRTVEAIAAVAILAVIFMTLSIRKILAPLRQLNQTSQEVANGRLEATFAIDSQDEIGELARSFNKMLQSLQHHLRITQEFEIARRMQTEMLPAAPPDLPGLRLEAASLPATEVGGDFYDFITLDDQRLAIIVGDVSGKGVSSAMVVSAALSAIRFAAEGHQTPAEILALANRRLAVDLQRGMFVAAFCGIFDLAAGRLLYANAGQTLPILYRNGEATLLPPPEEGDRFPLGINRQVAYGQRHLDLAAGDLLVFYTDGIVDMMNPENEPYSFDRFCAAVQRHARAAHNGLIPELIRDAEAFAGRRDHSDDLTLLVARYEGVPATVRRFEENGRRAAVAEQPVEIRLSLPSQPGFEKLAMNAAAELAQQLGFPANRVEDLRSAVAEACLNAIEHGNKLNLMNRLDVLLKPGAAGLTVQVIDNGSGFVPEMPATLSLERKISGEESPRGLGLFLIARLVDHVEYKVLPTLGHVTTLRLDKT
ncbi:MAG: SpoIIE family protein phosphatase [candidate division KSB1 bacterium]|nr:SpoIIE family protein phosphatase [candidate division KSB1 bacterium]MDZ7274570.1 SpoIIE family protein phosphatase [candidate division KSB1 bacterium]MDZ7284769.1 SpoIIE family protein phosphatase [candidate division KSB1 bacterium]MDZ7297811.1 SpoIIE family protein phosphatase [candidate division KSB1 bacterium]MDZ7307775.1 SpoIIE family protein phosphatase [candidate division KSB1 bacterium]